MNMPATDETVEPDVQAVTLDDERQAFNQAYTHSYGGVSAFGIMGLAPIPPLFVPGAEPLSNTADIGISRALVRPAPQGLLVEVQRYPDMRAGDVIEVFVHLQDPASEPTPVKTATLGQGREGRNIALYVPAEKIDAGLLVLYCRVTRARTREVQESLRLTALCKLSAPGGPDLKKDEPWHSELHAPQAPARIDAQTLGEFIQVTLDPYPLMEAGDTLRLHIGVEPLDYVVQPAEVGHTVTLHVPAGLLRQAGDSNALALDYQVIDRVGNVSEKWSARAFVQVRLGNTLLDAPRVLGAAVPQVLDTRTLGDGGASLLVWASEALFQAGDEIDVVCTGIAAQGQRIEIRPPRQTVTELGKAYLFMLPTPELNRLSLGLLKAHYRLRRANADAGQSLHRYVDVLGSVPELARAVLVEADGGVLDPALARCTVTVSYPGMASGDWVKLFWHGLTAQNYAYVWEVGRTVSRNDAARQQMTYLLGAEHIAALDGGSLQLSYWVFGEAMPSPMESPRLWVQVGALQAELAPPTVAAADADGSLAQVRIGQGIQVRIPEAAQIDSDDEVTVQWVCSTAAGSIEGQAHSFSFDVPEAVLQAGVGQSIEVSYRVRNHEDGRVQLSATRQLRIIPDEPLVLRAPVVLDSDSQYLDPVSSPSGIRFQAAYQGMVAQDEVVLTVNGKQSYSSAPQRVDALKPLVFILPDWVVRGNTGSLIQVSYSMRRRTQAALNSPALSLQVRDDLAIAINPLELNGLSVKVQGWPVTGVPSVGNTATRVANGGVPPYTYTSSKPGVASVTATGLVTGNGNGTAVITVTDQRGSQVSYPVLVSNVYRLIHNWGPLDHNQAVAWMLSLGNCEPCSGRAIADLQRVYGRTLPTGTWHFWLCEKNGCGGSGFAFYHYTNHAVFCADYFNTNIKAAWCIQRT